MMTTQALDRAATSVAACLQDAPVSSDFSLKDVNGWTEEKAYEIARAVLMAVRTPDEAMRQAGWDNGPKYDDMLEPNEIYTAMIDSILEGNG